MKAPKVSICIPAYQQIEYLRRTLGSICIQTFSDYEIIVTDDSVDGSVKNLVDSFDFQGRLKYFKNPSRLGSPENWNEAIRNSQGKYIKMLHHDDWFSYENSLAEFVAMLDERPDADFAFSAALVYNEKNKSTTVFMPDSNLIDFLKDSSSNLFFANFIGPPSSVIYRSTLNITYDQNLKWVVDIDFYIRALKVNKRFVSSSKTLITSTTEAKHQITNDCLDNKCVELFEYTYLYGKLNQEISFKEKLKFFFFFKKLMRKYKVFRSKEILDCGYKEDLPFIVWLAVLFNRLSL